MLKIRAYKAAWNDRIEFLAMEGDAVGIPLTLQKVEPGLYAQEPTFNLDQTGAQLLMDELWHCGLRPSEGSGSAGSLAATERHLKDMRALAMGLLRKDGVEVHDKP